MPLFFFCCIVKELNTKFAAEDENAIPNSDTLSLALFSGGKPVTVYTHVTALVNLIGRVKWALESRVNRKQILAVQMLAVVVSMLDNMVYTATVAVQEVCLWSTMQYLTTSKK